MENTGTLTITTMVPRLAYNSLTRKYAPMNEKPVIVARLAYITEEEARAIVGEYEDAAHGTIFAQWQPDVVQIR